MEYINKVKSISIWIFIVPFVMLIYLILITQFQGLFQNQEDVIHDLFRTLMEEPQLVGQLDHILHG